MTTLNVQGQSNLNDVSANNLYLTGNLITNGTLNIKASTTTSVSHSIPDKN